MLVFIISVVLCVGNVCEIECWWCPKMMTGEKDNGVVDDIVGESVVDGIVGEGGVVVVDVGVEKIVGDSVVVVEIVGDSGVVFEVVGDNVVVFDIVGESDEVVVVERGVIDGERSDSGATAEAAHFTPEEVMDHSKSGVEVVMVVVIVGPVGDTLVVEVVVMVVDFDGVGRNVGVGGVGVVAVGRDRVD